MKKKPDKYILPNVINPCYLDYIEDKYNRLKISYSKYKEKNGIDELKDEVTKLIDDKAGLTAALMTTVRILKRDYFEMYPELKSKLIEAGILKQRDKE